MAEMAEADTDREVESERFVEMRREAAKREPDDSGKERLNDLADLISDRFARVQSSGAN
jgi:hypothetical protein